MLAWQILWLARFYIEKVHKTIEVQRVNYWLYNVCKYMHIK